MTDSKIAELAKTVKIDPCIEPKEKILKNEFKSLKKMIKNSQRYYGLKKFRRLNGINTGHGAITVKIIRNLNILRYDMNALINLAVNFKLFTF